MSYPPLGAAFAERPVTVALLSVVMGFVALFAMFGLVLSHIRDDDRSHPLVTLLSITVPALSVLIVLLAPVTVLLTGSFGIEYVYPEAIYYETIWHLFASVFAVSLGLFVYELLVEGYLIGLLKYFRLPISAIKLVEGLLTAGLLLIVMGPVAQSVDVSWSAAMALGAISACVSCILEKWI